MINNFIQELGLQTFDYLLTTIEPSIIRDSFAKSFLQFCTAPKFCRDEAMFEKHRATCTYLMFKDNKPPCLSTGDETMIWMVMIDPKFIDNVKAFYPREKFFSQIITCLNQLVWTKSRPALIIALELLSRTLIDLINEKPDQTKHIMTSLRKDLIDDKSAFHFDRKGNYIAKSVIDVICVKNNFRDVKKWNELLDFQYELLNLMLSKEVYAHMDLDMYKAHFEVVISFIMKRFQNGGFANNTTHFIEVFQALVAFIFHRDEKEPGYKELRETFDTWFYQLIKFCNIRFPANGSVNFGALLNEHVTNELRKYR